MMDPITKNRQDFERKVAQVRSNGDLNDEAKRRMIGESYEEASERHRELVEEQERQEAESVDRLLFGTGPPGPVKLEELQGYAGRGVS